MKTKAGWICVILAAMWVIGLEPGFAAERAIKLVIQKSLHGVQRLDLKQGLRRQYPNFNFREYRLSSVEVTAEAGRGGGTAALQAGSTHSDTVPIDRVPRPGKPRHPNRIFHQVFISNPSPYDNGPWLLMLDGHLFVETVQLNLEDLRSSGPEPGPVGSDMRLELQLNLSITGIHVMALKRKIQVRYPRLDLNRYELQYIQLLVKSRAEQGEVMLKVGGTQSRQYTVAGSAGDFERPSPHTFHLVQIENPSRGSRGEWEIILKGAIRVSKVLVYLGQADRRGPRIASEFCVRHSRRSPNAGVRDTGWICLAGGQESDWIFLGDDTGYLDQKLKIRVSGPNRVCLRFSHRSPEAGVRDSGWVCSSHGKKSDWIFLGDDTGYRDQKLMIRAEGPEPYCIRQSLQSPNSGQIDTGWACSSNGRPSDWIWLGDDTGYRDQKLKIRH